MKLDHGKTLAGFVKKENKDLITKSISDVKSLEEIL